MGAEEEVDGAGYGDGEAGGVGGGDLRCAVAERGGDVSSTNILRLRRRVGKGLIVGGERANGCAIKMGHAGCDEKKAYSGGAKVIKPVGE